MASILDDIVKKAYVSQKSLTAEDLKKAVAVFKEEKNNPKPKEPVEEWVWVTGYKGTDKDMKCRGYQYEMGKLHSMPEDAKIEDCRSGFHFCLNMNNVRDYYTIGENHRYFEVQAFVRKKDRDMYGLHDPSSSMFYFGFGDSVRDKLCAKSIIFTRELTVDEILKDTEAADWTSEYKQMAIEKGIKTTRAVIQAKELATLGYSEAFAQYIAEEGSYEDAKKVASQKDLSMDMKVLCILRGM